MSLSRMFAHETSRISSTSRSSASPNPRSAAAMSTAAAERGTYPILRRFTSRSFGSFQDFRSHDDGLGDVGDPAFLVHRCLAQDSIGVVFGQILRAHQDALSAVDDLAVFEGGLGPVELV